MLLSDRDLIAALRTGDLVVRPLGETAMQPASIDVRLGPKLIVDRAPAPDWASHRTDGTYRISWDLENDGPFRLNQGDFVLGATLEWVEVGPGLAAVIVGKSSRAREGMVIEDAGYIDPGWKGEITLELSNRSPVPLMLEAGMYIGQLRVQALTGRPIRLYGDPGLGSHYQGSQGPRESFTREGVKAG